MNRVPAVPSSPAVADIRAKPGLPLAMVESMVARVTAGTMTKADEAVFIDHDLIVEDADGFHAVVQSETSPGPGWTRVDDEWDIIRRYCSAEVEAMFAEATDEEFSAYFCNLCDLEQAAAEDALAAGLVTRKPVTA